MYLLTPPYGRDIKYWVEKSYNEYLSGNTVIMLIPARTDTQYWHDFIFGKAKITFIKGRVKFGDGKSPAPFPSAIIEYKQNNNVNEIETLDIKKVRKYYG